MFVAMFPQDTIGRLCAMFVVMFPLDTFGACDHVSCRYNWKAVLCVCGHVIFWYIW